MTDWLCQGPQIWSMCDVTRRQRPMTALVSFTLEKLARKHALNPTLGLFAAASLFRLPACFISAHLYLSKRKSATRINAKYTSTRKELRNYPKYQLKNICTTCPISTIVVIYNYVSILKNNYEY